MSDESRRTRHSIPLIHGAGFRDLKRPVHRGSKTVDRPSLGKA